MLGSSLLLLMAESLLSIFSFSDAYSKGRLRVNPQMAREKNTFKNSFMV